MTTNLLKGKYENYIYEQGKELNVNKLRGGFSDIYIGKRQSDNSKVLIKKLKRIYLNDLTEVLRLYQEAKMSLSHPAFVKPLEWVEESENYYFVREFVEGINCKTLLSTPKIAKKKWIVFIVKSLIQTLDGLQYLHENNIIHRDIKPSNIILETENDFQRVDYLNPKVRIIDFGLSKINSENIDKNERVPFSLLYSAPEQVLNYEELINITTDLYSLGITFYELLALKPPFWHENPEVLMNLQITYPLVPVSAIPKQLFSILAKATAKYRFAKPPNKYSKEIVYQYLKEGQKMRYQSTNEMKIDLEIFLNEFEKENGLFYWLKGLFS